MAFHQNLFVVSQDRSRVALSLGSALRGANQPKAPFLGFQAAESGRGATKPILRDLETRFKGTFLGIPTLFS